MKYAKCSTLNQIKTGNAVNPNFTVRNQEYNLKCNPVPTSKNNSCKIPNVNNAQKILITKPLRLSNGLPILDTTTPSDTKTKVNWEFGNNNGVSSKYSVESDGTDVYIYKTGGTDITDISYKILDIQDCNFILSNKKQDLITKLTNMKTTSDNMNAIFI